MPKFNLMLSDTLTTERVLALEVQATSEADAKQIVILKADLLMTAFRDRVEEDQVSSTPYDVQGEDERSVTPLQTYVPADEVRRVLSKTGSRR